MPPCVFGTRHIYRQAMAIARENLELKLRELLRALLEVR